MKAYIYNAATKVIIALILGDDIKSIEAKYSEIGYNTDENGLTYNPAFGTIYSLKTDGDFEVIDVRG